MVLAVADDEYVEGDSGSAAADAPGVIPTDDAPIRDAKQGGFDSSSTHDAPVISKPRAAARAQQARKAFAEAVLANKKEAATKPPSEADELDPEAPIVAAKPVAKPTELAATGDATAAKVAEAKPVDAPALIIPVAAPPAPSLDPEVRQLTAYLKAEREKLDADRAEWDKQRKAAEPVVLDTNSLEAYVDSPPAAYRNWLEAMRGEKYSTDDEFKSEVRDFVTILSDKVLGVPLPDSVRNRLDAEQAKKIVRTHKTLQTRKEAAAAAKAEKDQAEATTRSELAQVEAEWSKAAVVLSQQFTPDSPAAKSYPWLAVEDEPGKIIVDVIRAAGAKDGTTISWTEASKRANDYLAEHNTKHYDKRKPLLSATAPVVPIAAKPAPAPAPVAPPPVAATPPAPQRPNKWDRDRHIENTKAAFRAMIASKTE